MPLHIIGHQYRLIMKSVTSMLTKYNIAAESGGLYKMIILLMETSRIASATFVIASTEYNALRKWLVRTSEIVHKPDNNY